MLSWCWTNPERPILGSVHTDDRSFSNEGIRRATTRQTSALRLSDLEQSAPLSARARAHTAGRTGPREHRHRHRERRCSHLACCSTVRNNSHVDDSEELPSRLPLGDRDLAVQRRMPPAAAQFGVRLRGSCYLERRSSWMNRSTSRASTPPAIAAVGNCERDFRWTTINRSARFGEARRNESSGMAMDGRTVFPALASTNHRSELVRGMRKSTFKPC